MNDQQYQMLTDKYEKSHNPFRVVLFFSKPNDNLHAFTILDDKTPIAVGLPIPRKMSFMQSDGCHVSRTAIWDQYIKAGELYWHPVRTQNSKEKKGKFIPIPKTADRVDDLGNSCEESEADLKIDLNKSKESTMEM